MSEEKTFTGYDGKVNEYNNPLDEDGLTTEERTYLEAPFAQLSPDQQRMAMRIKEKLAANRWAANEEYRKGKLKIVEEII